MGKLPTTIEQYRSFAHGLRKLSDESFTELVKTLCLCDLYFLVWYVLRRDDIEHPWLLARCQEVQASPNGHLDLWSREHYKSTIITFGLTIQDILRNPETTAAIFSHTRPTAKALMRPIKQECERNGMLKEMFPEVLYAHPKSESPKWSEDDGIVVRRRGNHKEATLEAWGLIDGMPTAKHFGLMIYDDLVTEKSVTTPEQIQKTNTALEMSYNLGSKEAVRRFIGTRYHGNDSYRMLLDRGTAQARLHPGTKDGTVTGTPVYWSQELLAQKRRDMGPYTFASQILLNPVADEAQNFKREWLRKYRKLGDTSGLNTILLFDPASSKKKGSDYTAAWAVTLGRDRNVYVRDMVRDRLNLIQRADLVFDWHRTFKPKQVRYEEYGLQADIEHFESRMEDLNYRFQITPVGGATAKSDRIKRLIPWFEQQRIWLPQSLHSTLYDKRTVDLVHVFIEEEYAPFPVPVHDDLLDALARLAEPDLSLPWPMESDEPGPAAPGDTGGAHGWMAH